MESTKSVVIPVDAHKVRPTVVPYGGIGGLLFWVSVCIFLGISTFHFYSYFTVRDREARALQGDSELLRRENQKLRSVVDQLQTELGQTGSLLRLQQELLGQSAAANGGQEAKKEPPRDPVLSPSERLDLRTLEERLDRALAAQVSAKEAAILPKENGVVIAIDSRALFPGAGLKVGSAGQMLLHEVAAGLQPLLGSVEVRVIAFATPASEKNPRANWEVPSLRSAAVAKALVDGEHLPPKRVVASCRGAGQRSGEGVGEDEKMSSRRLEIGLFLSADSSERQDGR